MNKKISHIEKMLALSIAFTMLLLTMRIIHTQQWMYVFYVWNTFLAIIPLLFSRKLAKLEKPGIKAIALIAGWLLFFPNAPYIITDVFHYEERLPVPRWYDLMLVVSAAWNGLLLGIVSLMQVERFLSQHLRSSWVKLSVFISLGLCGYGIYIGRFLRFNSWDIITHPRSLLSASAYQVLHPHRNIVTWEFTFLFSVMLCIIYFTLKQLPRLFTERNHYQYQ